MQRFEKGRVEKFIREVLFQVGLTEEDARQAAEVIIQADSSGVETHGLARLPVYAQRYKIKAVNLRPNVHQINDSDLVIALDGDNGSGLTSGPLAMRKCIETTKKYGVGVVTVNHSSHFGCANYYGWNFAREDLIGIVFSNTVPLITPTGGKERMIGTNPINIAVPAYQKDPVVLDMAITVASLGKIQVKALANESIPIDWVKDLDGNPITDANKAVDGILQPIGGYKGYGLALMIDIFCSVLAQAGYGPQLAQMDEIYTSKPEGIGHFMMAVDPSRLMPIETFKKNVDAYIECIKGSQAADGVEEILVPGEIEFRKFRETEKNGIEVRDELAAKLVALCDELELNHNKRSEFGDLLDDIYER